MLVVLVALVLMLEAVLVLVLPLVLGLVLVLVLVLMLVLVLVLVLVLLLVVVVVAVVVLAVAVLPAAARTAPNVHPAASEAVPSWRRFSKKPNIIISTETTRLKTTRQSSKTVCGGFGWGGTVTPWLPSWRRAACHSLPLSPPLSWLSSTARRACRLPTG